MPRRQQEDELPYRKAHRNGKSELAPVVEAAIASARAAGLRYTTDSRPGIRRTRHGSTFRYHGPDGRRITSAEALARIRSLVIPPAWTDVWICPDPLGHLQATGRDARRRKQYRYHPKWRVVRDETKYDRLVGFAQTLPKIRQSADRDTRRPGMPRDKVLATVVQLLEKTLIRVGNVEYARSNGSFGLTTLRDHHVTVRGGRVRFQFKGKSGVKQMVDLSDARLAQIVKRCQELPGQVLFQYVDEQGRRRAVTSADVNAYVRAVTGGDYTAKDFRTWAGSLLAVDALRDLMSERTDVPSARAQKGIVVEAVATVARHLGNTPAVCRGSYIHPVILTAQADGRLATMGQSRRRRVRGLSASEASLLALLSSRVTLRDQLAASVRAIKAANPNARHRTLKTRRRSTRSGRAAASRA